MIVSLLDFTHKRSLMIPHQTPFIHVKISPKHQTANCTWEIRLSGETAVQSWSLIIPNSLGYRAFSNTGTHCWLFRTEYPADEEVWNNKDRHPAGLSDHISTVTARCPPSSQHSPLRAGHFHPCRGTESKVRSMAENSICSLLSGNLAAQHFCKHPAQLSHSECPRNQEPARVEPLGNVSLPRSVAAEVTGSSGSSPVSQPQNFLPPLTITYVGFLNSFFLHFCLNSTGKRKRRLDVEN